MKEKNYSIKREVNFTYDEAIKAVTEELKKEGFGVLTEIDVKATLKKKIDQDFRNYIILGACNPKLAFGMLKEEMDIGLLLPCNIVVYESDQVGKSVVAAIDPVSMLEVTGRDDLIEVAAQVKEKLNRVIQAL